MQNKKRVQIAVSHTARCNLNVLAARLSAKTGQFISSAAAAEQAIARMLREVEDSLGILPERIDQATGAEK